MKEMEKRAFIFGGIFALANRLQVLGDAMDKNITVKQWFLLAMILRSDKDSLTIGELSKLIGNSHQNVKKMVVILEKQGFVNMCKDSLDARKMRVSLTKKCFEYFEQRQGMESGFMEKLFDGFDEGLLDGLCQGMNMLSNNMEKMEDKNESEE